MGIDYESKAGYGVRIIKSNLTEEYQTLLDEKYDGDTYDFVKSE